MALDHRAFNLRNEVEDIEEDVSHYVSHYEAEQDAAPVSLPLLLKHEGQSREPYYDS